MTLRLENLVIYNREGETLFSPINMEVESNTVTVVMGPSGCGKSTLLNFIAGHHSDDFNYEGTITLNDEVISELPAHKRNIGILFQDDLLFPHLNVWQNLAFALPNSIKKAEREERAHQALKRIGLENIAHSYPSQISGGQRARVSLIRMLLANPSAVLLDEPFSKLDKDLRIQFRNWVFEQLSEAKIPTLLVTHDQSDVPQTGQIANFEWTHTHA
tara:strand:+ start:1221 stop:1868 length:648 start_codon:yes stop_codon:yes gene_type:complete